MFSIRTILHPTDFSDFSKYSFVLACSFARSYGARLIVLHVATPPIVACCQGVVLPEQEACDEHLLESLQCLQAGDPDIQAQMERRLVRGDAVTEILRAAEETKCDLIVMGTHGRTGLGRLLMGSVAEGVLRKASCPVLTLKTPQDHLASSDESIALLVGGEAELAH